MNRSIWISARLLPPPRPPALYPRRRSIDQAIQRRLRVWIRNALQLPSITPIALSEWVSMDSRCVPHTLRVVIGSGDDLRHFVIENASARITEPDVFSATTQKSSDFAFEEAKQ